MCDLNCKKCRTHDTDQIGDIVCLNKKSSYYLEFVEDLDRNSVNKCNYFEEDEYERS